MPNACLVVGFSQTKRIFLKIYLSKRRKTSMISCLSWWPTINSSYKSSIDANHLALSLLMLERLAFLYSSILGLQLPLAGPPSALELEGHHMQKPALCTHNSLDLNLTTGSRGRFKLSPGDGRLIHQPWQY